MFEKEIKFIYDFNLNKLNKYGSFFSFEQLKESDIHPAILHYISAEMDYLIFEDRQKLVRDSIFDYSGEKVASYFAMINEELKKSKRLSSDYVAKIMLHSISFNVNFLVRPKWALAKFIYEDESHRTGAEIKQILNYVYFYKYLRKIIISYLNTKKVLSLNSVEFAELLKSIDEATVQSNYRGMITASLDAMAEFFNIGGLHRTRVPFNAVQIFLEDKGLDSSLAKLREVYADDPNSRIEINDLKNLLTSVLVKKVEFETEQIKEEKVIEPEPMQVKHTFTEPAQETESSPHTEEAYEEDEVRVGKIIEEESEPEEVIPVREFNSAEFEAEENKPEIKTDMEESGFLDNIIKKSEKRERREGQAEFISEMESLIEEEKLSEIEAEAEIKNIKEDYEDWVFVEEKEHTELIKEITEPIEGEVKKSKHGRKKNAVENEEEPTLFAENKEMSFGDVLSEEEEILLSNESAVKKYDDTHNDISKLLENKNMADIVDTIFDCDIEEVELMLNSISFFATYAEAERFINAYFEKMGVPLDLPEAVTFKNIIKENYSK